MVELEDVKRSFHCPNEAGMIRALQDVCKGSLHGVYSGVHKSL